MHLVTVTPPPYGTTVNPRTRLVYTSCCCINTIPISPCTAVQPVVLLLYWYNTPWCSTGVLRYSHKHASDTITRIPPRSKLLWCYYVLLIITIIMHVPCCDASHRARARTRPPRLDWKDAALPRSHQVHCSHRCILLAVLPNDRTSRKAQNISLQSLVPRSKKYYYGGL